MHARHRFFVGLIVGAGGCAQIVDADQPYVLVDAGSSVGTTGGSGGTGGTGIGTECKTNDDCPPTGSACKTTECMNGFCKTHNTLEGTSCTPGSSNVCDGEGTCVECTLAEHCVNIAEDQCTKRACVNQVCELKYLGPESPASPAVQQPGDCQIVVCDGIGGTKTVNDDTDTPDDDNGCTTDSCLNGSEVHKSVATGTSCGENSYCNALGQCVGCLKPSDCAGSFSFCKERACDSGICGVSYKADGTPLPENNQTPQDCLIVVCDGAGNAVTRVDTADVPIDANGCTRDACSDDGTASHPPEPVSTACSDGENDACDGFGTCKKSNGKACAAGSECVSGYCVDGVCCESDCDETCRACNVSPLTAGKCTMIPLGVDDGAATMPCTGTVSCDGNGVCRKDNGQSCSTADDCVHGFCVDGYCCENACTTTCKACGVSGALGQCVNALMGSIDDNSAPACNGIQACDGSGGCKLANGQTCSTGSQCASGKCLGGNPKTCQP